MSTAWKIVNQHGLEILGDTHTPEQGPPVACVLLIHGFKGYKDYGFIPMLARDLCERGMLVHRFNFSTSGMTNDTETFARPDLFEMNTWGRQVEDVVRVVGAIGKGEIAGKGLDRFLIGHSRGGATALLAAGRHHAKLGLTGVVTLSSVDRCNSMPPQEQDLMLQRGYTVTTSSRTGQELRIDANWLVEQLDHPQDHDVLAQTAHASKAGIAVCVIHGDDDESVDLEQGRAIAQAAHTPLIVLAGGDHVLNMPNPSTLQAPRSVQLLKAEDTITRFITKQAARTEARPG